MTKYDWSEEALRPIIEKSNSYREALMRMGANPQGSNYKTIKHKISLYGIDISHMSHNAINTGKTWTNRNLDEILVQNEMVIVSSDWLKKRLWKEEVLERKCSKCGITEWQGEPAPLQLDHINGNGYDNRLENLRILCPNCHAQTDTWTGKNRKFGITHNRKYLSNGEPNPNYVAPECLDCGNPVGKPGNRCVHCATALRTNSTPVILPTKAEIEVRLHTCTYAELAAEYNVAIETIKTRAGQGRRKKDLNYYCMDCGKKVYGKDSRCQSCAGKFYRKTKIAWPSDAKLRVRIAESSYSAVARELGVSDNAIRKHLGMKSSPVVKVPKVCLDCGKSVARANSRCLSCSNSQRATKIVWPSMENLRTMVADSNRSAVARELGVTPKSVEKRLKRYG